MNNINYRVGFTCVAVMKRATDEKTGKETVTRIHEGVIVQDFGSSVRVFNFAPRDKGGDVSAETSETFAVASRGCWIETIGTLDEKYPIPATLK